MLKFQVIVVSWILGAGIIGINIYYLSTGFVDWLIGNDLPRFANIFIGILVFPLMAVYILAVIYLTFRKDVVVTFTDDSTKSDMEIAADRTYDLNLVPHTEDV